VLEHKTSLLGEVSILLKQQLEGITKSCEDKLASITAEKDS
jgi:hypothetical protein